MSITRRCRAAYSSIGRTFWESLEGRPFCSDGLECRAARCRGQPRVHSGGRNECSVLPTFLFLPERSGRSSLHFCTSPSKCLCWGHKISWASTYSTAVRNPKRATVSVHHRDMFTRRSSLDPKPALYTEKSKCVAAGRAACNLERLCFCCWHQNSDLLAR